MESDLQFSWEETLRRSLASLLLEAGAAMSLDQVAQGFIQTGLEKSPRMEASLCVSAACSTV